MDLSPLLVSCVGALWAGVTFIVGERRVNNDWVSKVLEQLDEQGATIREDYEIQKFLCDTYEWKPEDFKERGKVVYDKKFFLAKTIVYSYLNLFDSLIARTTLRGRPLPGWRKQLRRVFVPNSVELHNWQTYVRAKLKHPFFAAVLEEEGMIFGDALWCFYWLRVRKEKALPKKPKRVSRYLW